VQWILGVLAIVAVVGLLGTVAFSDSAGAIHGYEEAEDQPTDYRLLIPKGSRFNPN
jgi:hypothetical protein